MVQLPENIKELFYNPDHDSIFPLVKCIEDIHENILKMTDVSKCVLCSGKRKEELDFLNFRIAEQGISSDRFASTISELFDGLCRWHFPSTMYNVVPVPIIPAVAAKTLTALYNPNLCLDTASGQGLSIEQSVIRAIAEFIGWNGNSAGGAFTWGGKATIMYGIKTGLKNCCPDSSKTGVKDDVVVFSTSAGHPAHVSDADWLGIGTENVFRIRTAEDERVDINEMERAIKEKIEEGKKIAAIIISGGNTNSMIVDPIEEVANLRDRLVKELGLNYVPHLHVDAVVSFPWIFFKDYDFIKNPLNIEGEALRRIAEILRHLKGLYRADSFGIDFHKMGFSPYMSCVFMVKNKISLYGNSDVSRWPFFYTIENSRPADGPNSAYIVLKILGATGFQMLLAHLTEITVDLQNKIEESGEFKIVDPSGLGTSVMFVPRLPEGVTITKINDESIVRDNYTSKFVKKIKELNFPYYIDQMPGNCSGSCSIPLTSLKAYITSPHSTVESNTEFVNFLINLKREIDLSFDFTDTKVASESVLPHPLKQ